MRAFRRARLGATAVEYALVAGSIALAIVTAVALLGGGVGELYQSIVAAFG